MHRRLKNYQKYLNKILRLAKDFRLKVVITKGTTDDGIFIPLDRAIIVRKGLSNSFTISVLLHELGHFLYDEQIPRKLAHKVDTAYKSMDRREYITENQADVILDCEKRAWRNGKVIANILNIPLGVWFTSAKNHSLATYRRD